MSKKINPWAVCHSQLGKKKTDKFERCVMKIKTKHGIKDWTELREKLVRLKEHEVRKVSLREKLAYLFEQPQAGAAALARKRKDIAPGETQSDEDILGKKSAFMKAFKAHKAGEAERKKRGDIPTLKTHTEYEGPSLKEKITHLVEKKKKDWIQGAVDPKHKGYCTPMTKKTCTPARKALAQRFKKAGRREGTKAGGKTGWKGKV